MLATLIAALVLTGIIVWVLLAPSVREKKREAIRQQPFPERWAEILRRRMPLFAKLPDSLREQLQDDIKVFVAEKRFVACEELELTDEIEVTIAAQACLLTLNRRKTYYPRLTTIYVYPSAYVVRTRNWLDGGGQVETQGVNLGESWSDGRLVLAWDASKHGAINVADGHNVVFHEFAHQLDQEDGTGDGVPLLDAPAKYAQWVEVLGEHYEMLRKRRRRRSVVDKYGATNPAEFFSSATEAFFEKPHQMRRKMADLYDELKDYYRVDPASWT